MPGEEGSFLNGLKDSAPVLQTNFQMSLLPGCVPLDTCLEQTLINTNGKRLKSRLATDPFVSSLL